MKISYLFSLSILMLLLSTTGLTGCDKKQEIEQTEEIRPVKTMLVSAPDLGGIRYFPGRVDADKRAELAFRVAGKVQELLVKEGDMVKQGDVVAKLDPTDFQIAVDNKQATFTRAEKDYERGKKLVKEGHISKRDFDGLEATFLSTRAEFNLAKQQLDYTELKAPFDGVIARRHIQSFEEVEAKQSIVTLNDNEILEVKFDLPENLILRIQHQEGVEIEELSLPRYKILVTASFQSQTDKEYTLSFKEISTKADEKTQTFTATYTMPAPDDFNLMPGMSATVKIDSSQYIKAEKNSFKLPVSAVVADAGLQGVVWIVNEENMQVEPVSVKVGIMKGNQIQITEGIEEGQRVVVAGVPFLYKGLKVTLMKEAEQARDNLEHERPQMNKKNEKSSNNNTPKEG